MMMMTMTMMMMVIVKRSKCGETMVDVGMNISFPMASQLSVIPMVNHAALIMDGVGSLMDIADVQPA
jgi:hypothetical protein